MLTTVDIEKDLWEKAKILAVKEKTSLKEIINKALGEYLERRGELKEGGKKK
jgi:predicted transcriptional regulator